MEAQQSEGESIARGRIMGVDLGKARVGVALSDARGILASPFTTIKRVADKDDELIHQLLKIAEEEEVSRIIVGVPKSLTNENKFAENEANQFISALSEVSKVPIVGVDERFTTVFATKRLRELGHDSRSMKSKLDASAAAEILQIYLDARGDDK